MGKVIKLPLPCSLENNGIYPRGRTESVFQKKNISMRGIIVCERLNQKLNTAEHYGIKQHFFSDKFDQQRSELLEKDKLIEELKNEVEKLKVELAQAQLLIVEREEAACVPSGTRATVCLLDNAVNSVHSQIKGNGDSLDRVEGDLISQGEEKMCTSDLDTEISGDFLGKLDNTSQLYASNAFFMRVDRAIMGYLETVTPEKYLDDLCRATYPRKPILYNELVEEIRKNKNSNHETR